MIQKFKHIAIIMLVALIMNVNTQNYTASIRPEGNSTESNVAFTLTAGSSMGQGNGKVGTSSYLFDGSTNALLQKDIITGDAVAAQFLSGDEYTFEAWVKTAATGDKTIVSYNYKNTTQFSLYSSNALVVNILETKVITNLAFNNDFWNHIAVTWSGKTGDLKVYKNGDLSYQAQNVATGKSFQCCEGKFVVGQDSLSRTSAWIGEIDEIYLHNTIKPRNDILKHIGIYCNEIKAYDPTVCSGHGKCMLFDKCSCNSGRFGDWCEKEASRTACTWNTPSKLKTDWYPKIDNSKVRFFADQLFLSIKSPLVNDRLETEVYIENEKHEVCKYPGKYWSIGYDDVAPCYNTFNAFIPWVYGKTCGWRESETPEQKIYSGNVFVKQREKIGDLRGTPITREIKSVIPLNIKFQKTIELSYEIKAFAPVNLLAAVTKQEYIPGPPHAGMFEFITQLQYPFMIDESAPIEVQQIPTPITTKITPAPENVCNPNAPCTQTFKMPITTNGACSFSGVYQYKLKLKCHPSITNPADCPLPSLTSSFAEIQITVNSEDFCSVVQIDIKLEGKLEAFEDAQYTIKKDAFLLNQTAHFQATLKSPQATLIESKVTRVQLIQSNGTQVLYDGGVNTNFGNLVEFKPDAGGATTCGFNFKFSQAHTPVAEDQSADFKVTSLIEVKYASIENNALSKVFYYQFTRYFDTRQANNPEAGTQANKYESGVKLTGTIDPTIGSGSLGNYIGGKTSMISFLCLIAYILLKL